MEDITKTIEAAKASVAGVTDKIGASAFTASRSAVEVSRKIDDEGTPLRAGIGFLRESLNGFLAKGHGAATSASAEVDGMVSVVRARVAPAVAPAVAHANQLRKSRPELLVGAITAPVLLLSVFGGKIAMVRNGLSCAVASGMAVYGLNFWDQRDK